MVFTRYKKASIAADHQDMHAAVMALLQLPSKVFTYNSSFSGKRKGSLVHEKLEEVIKHVSYFFSKSGKIVRPVVSDDGAQEVIASENVVDLADERTIR